MTDPVVIAAEQLALLNDQLWRRLGITQTFDRLLVEAVAAGPGAPADVRDAVGRNLSGGAVKFWELSFPGLVKDLARRGVVKSGEIVALADAFADRLQRIIADLEEGVSHVEPTPGVTLESVLAKAKAREEAAKAAKATRPRASRAKPKAAPKAEAKAAPIKRAAKAEASVAAPAVAAPAPAPTIAPANKLFTSLKLNRLLDSLDNSRLLKAQLGGRLDLSGANLDRFLEITDQLELTRTTPDGLVELHFRGRELARTGSADRRMVLIDLVRELRSAADS